VTVGELIEALSALEQDAQVKYAWDGAARSNVEMAWLAKGGYVVLAGHGDDIYYTEDRPADAPTEDESPIWCVPPAPTEKVS
jgi:hypothetical protein